MRYLMTAVIVTIGLLVVSMSSLLFSLAGSTRLDCPLPRTTLVPNQAGPCQAP